MVHLSSPINHYVYGALIGGCVAGGARRVCNQEGRSLSKDFIADALSFPLPFEGCLKAKQWVARYYEDNYLKFTKCPFRSNLKLQLIVVNALTILAYANLSLSARQGIDFLIQTHRQNQLKRQIEEKK